MITTEEILKEIDVLLGLARNPDTDDGIRNVTNYLSLLKNKLLNNDPNNGG